MTPPTLDKIYSYINHKYLFIVCFLLFFMFQMLFFNRYFPVSEGWFETYGYLINKGDIPYRDFYLPFPPLCVYVYAIWIKLFGISFVLFRFFGVMISMAIFTLIYFILSRIFSRKSSIVAAIVAIFLSASSPVYIAKDYHAFVDVLVAGILLSAIYLMLGNLKSSQERDDHEPSIIELNIKTITICIVLGILISLLILTKQNIGVFVSLSFGIAFLAIPFAKTSLRLALLIVTSSTALILTIIIGILFIHFGAPVSALIGLFLGNDSKGGGFTVLSRIISDPNNRNVVIESLILLAFYLVLGPRNLIKIGSFYNKMKYADYIINFSVIACSMSLIFKIGKATSIYETFIIPFSLSVIAYSAYRSMKKIKYLDIYDKERVLLFVLPCLGMLAYCNTQTAAFNYTGLTFIIALSITYILDLLDKFSNKKPYTIFVILAVSIFPAIFLSKIKEPYNWWGLTEGSIITATYSIKNPLLNKIKVNQSTCRIFEEIQQTINKYSTKENDVYLFPNIPIFYTLCNKLPPYKGVVQWFDVITTNQMQEELTSFERSPVKIVVVINPPEIVWIGHRQLIKRKLIQEDFIKKMDLLASTKKYSLVKYDILLPDLDYSPENEITSQYDIQATNADAIGKSLREYFNQSNDDANFHCDRLVRCGVELTGISPDTVIEKNDILGVSVKMSYFRSVALSLGELYRSQFFTLKIYLRND